MKINACRAIAVASVLSCVLLGGRGDAQEANPSKDLPFRVRSILVAKCSECHGRSLQRPRAALYLDDLGPLAARRDLVVPYDVEGSYLWHLIRNDDMPAKGAKAGPLSQEEKAIIRAWITAGAPVPPALARQASQPQAAAPQAPPGTVTAAAPALLTRLFGWLGRFHILVIHFPIALLAAAALGEAIAALRSNQSPEPMVRFCVLLGATGALPAVALGWLHADVGGFGAATSGVVGLHRWLGTAGGLWAVSIVWVSERESRRGQRTLLFRILLWSGTLLVAAAAHFGGLLVHGEQFFEW
jgi:hypothetical protein